MSRKRSISSDISTDPRVAELAQYGPLPLLLYTWGMTHADDWGRLTGEPVQFRLTVCPALSVSASEVEEALNQIAQTGLWERYQVDGRWYIAYPLEAWYKHQSYIAREKRTNDKSQYPPPPPQHTSPQDTEQCHSVAQSGEERQSVAVSVPSPSPSPEKIVSLSEHARAREEAAATAPPAEPIHTAKRWRWAAPELEPYLAAWRRAGMRRGPSGPLAGVVLEAIASGMSEDLLAWIVGEMARRTHLPMSDPDHVGDEAAYASGIIDRLLAADPPVTTLEQYQARDAEFRARIESRRARAAPEQPQFLNKFV